MIALEPNGRPFRLQANRKMVLGERWAMCTIYFLISVKSIEITLYILRFWFIYQESRGDLFVSWDSVAPGENELIEKLILIVG